MSFRFLHYLAFPLLAAPGDIETALAAPEDIGTTREDAPTAPEASPTAPEDRTVPEDDRAALEDDTTTAQDVPDTVEALQVPYITKKEQQRL